MLEDVWERLKTPGSTKRSVIVAGLLIIVSVGLAYGTTFVGQLNTYAQKVLGRDAPIEITDGAKHGRLSSVQYSFPKYDGKLHLRHFPPCAENDAGCVVDLDVRQETNAPRIFVFTSVLAALMFLFGLAAILLGGRRAAGILHGKCFRQSHTMKFVDDTEECYVQRTCDGMWTEGTSLLVPTQLNYVQKYATGQPPVQLSEPSFRWNGTDVEMTKVNQANDYYDGIIWFTREKGPLTFHLEYTVKRNMYRDLNTLKLRKGADAKGLDEHHWRSAANWAEVEMHFDWSKDFSVSSPRAFITAGHGAAEREIPRGPLFSVISNDAGQRWTLKLPDVSASSEIRVAWVLQ